MKIELSDIYRILEQISQDISYLVSIMETTNSDTEDENKSKVDLDVKKKG